MSEHLDLDALADLLAGEGGGEDHLSGCGHCAARLGELADAEAPVAASLGRLAPPALPPELADRFAGALAAEPPLAPQAPAVTPADVVAGAGSSPAAVPTAAAVPAAGTVTPLSSRSFRPTRRLRGHPAWLPSVAAGVVLVCGAGIGFAVLRDGARSGDETATAAGETAGPGVPSGSSGVDYADDAAARSALPEVLAGSPRRGQAADSRAGAPPPAAPTTGSTAVPPGAAESADPLATLRRPDGLASCLMALLPPQEPDLRPLALDYASYAGAPALAVVLPDPDPAKVSIYVVGPACTATTDDLKYFLRLDRP